jgi:hypothetical protein
MSHLRQSRHRLAGWIGKPTKAPKRKKEETNKTKQRNDLGRKKGNIFCTPYSSSKLPLSVSHVCLRSLHGILELELFPRSLSKGRLKFADVIGLLN